MFHNNHSELRHNELLSKSYSNYQENKKTSHILYPITVQTSTESSTVLTLGTSSTVNNTTTFKKRK